MKMTGAMELSSVRGSATSLEFSVWPSCLLQKLTITHATCIIW